MRDRLVARKGWHRRWGDQISKFSSRRAIIAPVDPLLCPLTQHAVEFRDQLIKAARQR